MHRVLGGDVARFDVPPLLRSVDSGPRPTPLERALELAADLYGASRTWFLTNGASQGVVLAILAAAQMSGEVVMQRNVHSSAVSGLVLAGTTPHWAQPNVDAVLGAAHGLEPEALRRALEQAPSARVAFVVSPSYFGAVADVAGLVRVAHEADCALIVDESWGSHFAISDALPPSALSCGADVVVSSSHKLGGSLTQSAMLHLGRGPRSRRLGEEVERLLPLLESTSASSLLLASLDAARQQMAVTGPGILEQALANAATLRAAVDGCSGVRVADAQIRADRAVADLDPLRLTLNVSATGHTGFAVAQHLRDHGIDVEMATFGAIVAVVGPGQRDDVQRPVRSALLALPDRPAPAGRRPLAVAPVADRRAATPREATFAAGERVPWAQAAGRVSADTLSAYPPGIPNVLPGEVLTAELLDGLRATVEAGGWIRGARPGLASLRVTEERAA